jgi:hypothetical protein
VDLTGRITGYALVNLQLLGRYDWRLASTNVWKAERFLLDYPHRPIRSSDRRIDAFRKRYRAFKASYPDRKPVFYAGRWAWTELPASFGPDWRTRPE